jgi:hypothetical protein
MLRKRFLAVLAGAPALAAQAPQPSPCEKKFAFAQTWAKRLINILDADFDEATRTRLLEAAGRECYRSGHPDGKEKPDLEKTLAGLAKFTGPENLRRTGEVIDINLNNAKCLCPLAETGPEGLSGTYCVCSAGYMKTMFSPFGKPRVEIVDTVKRGGKSCRFRVTLGKA